MPRARPRRGWKKLPRGAVCLTAGQTARLRRVKLPEAARPAVDEIARHAIAQAGEDYPQSGEMRAAMKLLHDKIRALRSAIADCDEWTKGKINIADVTTPFVVNSADAKLAELEAAINAADRKLAARKKARPGLFALNVALQLRNVFEVFDIPFERTKRSPALETLSAILNFVSPTGLDAVDHHIRGAKKFGE
jgi:hypothetical protein